jgi:hypothetical protein
LRGFTEVLVDTDPGEQRANSGQRRAQTQRDDERRRRDERRPPVNCWSG